MTNCRIDASGSTGSSTTGAAVGAGGAAAGGAATGAVGTGSTCDLAANFCSSEYSANWSAYLPTVCQKPMALLLLADGGGRVEAEVQPARRHDHVPQLRIDLRQRPHKILV